LSKPLPARRCRGRRLLRRIAMPSSRRWKRIFSWWKSINREPEQRETLAINRGWRASFGAALRLLAIVLLIVAILLPLSAGLVLTGLYHLMKQVIEQKMTLKSF